MFYGIKFIQDNRNKRKIRWSYIYLPPFFFILPVVLFNMPGITVGNEDFMYFHYITIIVSYYKIVKRHFSSELFVSYRRYAFVDIFLNLPLRLGVFV